MEIVIAYVILNSFGFPVGAAELLIALDIETAGEGIGSHASSVAVGTSPLTVAQFNKPVTNSPVSNVQLLLSPVNISGSTIY